MYNAEKYIGECLDSLLNQTLQDFEVIIVNDCSTDNSLAIAETYIEKFSGRLKIFDNEKNSGAGATRNNGLRLATGEYVFFMDADDLILAHGLEKLYTTAKQFDVDVVNDVRYYRMSNDGKELNPHILKPYLPNNAPILESNLEWRVQGLLNDNFAWAPWRRILRREFLIKNEIFFPEDVVRNEDEVWTHGLLFFAKKIIHIPLSICLYRLSESSITRVKRTPLQNISAWTKNIIFDLKYIDNFMSKVPFFKENPDYAYAILEHSTQRFFNRIFKSSLRVLPSDIHLSIKQEFGKKFGEYRSVIPVLCTMINQYQQRVTKNEERIAELEKQLKIK